MNRKRRIIGLIMIMAISIAAVSSLTIFLLYNAVYEGQKARLVEIAQSRALVIEAVDRFGQQYGDQDVPGGAFSVILSQTIDASGLFESFGETGEFILAERDEDRIVFLFGQREHRPGCAEAVLFSSGIAEPMRQALSGKSGSMVGLDYRGVRVLAAHEPVYLPNLGIVAKIDLAEIRAPIIKAGMLTLGIGLLTIIIGTSLLLRISDPRIRQIEETRRRLKYIFSAGPVIIYTSGTSAPYAATFISENVASQLGYDVANFLRDDNFWVAHIHPEDRQSFLEERAELIDKGYRSLEYRFSHKDGYFLWLHDEIRLAMDSRGIPFEIVGGLLDITQRKMAEIGSGAPVAGYQDLYENGSDMHVSFHPETARIIYCDEKLAKSIGYTKEEIIGLPVFEIYDPGCVAQAKEALSFFVTSGEVHDKELQLRKKDGTIIEVNLNVTAVRDGAGKILCGRSSMRDITERGQAEKELRESEEKYRSLVENIDIGISLISPQMQILSLNRKMREWFPNIDLSAKPICYEAFNSPQKKKICSYCPTVRTFRDGLVHEAVTETPSGDDIKNYRVISSPIKNNSGNIVAATKIVVDITEKLKIENELARRDKLESLGTLASGIAHDFNNLLAGFLGSISLARMDVEPGTESFRALDRAERACLRAEQLTRQLLTFSRGGAPVKERTSVADLVRDTVSFALSGSNVRCDIRIQEGVWEARIDRGQISQVVQNLVLNAAQAMPQGGNIKISIENIIACSSHPMLADKDKYLKISIQDQGTGIRKEDLGKIFDPYFTTKRQGNGLGLATVYSIVKNHCGHIDIDSKLGKGTTFHVYLPATGKLCLKQRPDDKMIIHGNGKVLLMDDEELIRNMLEDLLKRIGYAVTCAADGQEAIELFKKENDKCEPFDIVILDLTVPGSMGGKEVITRLREIDPQIKAIVSSGYANDRFEADFREWGFSGCLSKPFETGKLSRVLVDVMKRNGLR